MSEEYWEKWLGALVVDEQQEPAPVVPTPTKPPNQKQHPTRRDDQPSSRINIQSTPPPQDSSPKEKTDVPEPPKRSKVQQTSEPAPSATVAQPTAPIVRESNSESTPKAPAKPSGAKQDIVIQVYAGKARKDPTEDSNSGSVADPSEDSIESGDATKKKKKPDWKPREKPVKKGKATPEDSEVIDLHLWLEGWTGKIPKTLLQNYCQNNGMTTPQYKQKRCNVPNAHQYGVEVSDKSRTGVVSNTRFFFKRDEAFEDSFTAQHAAACWALYCIDNAQPVYRVLPRPFSKLWQRWIANDAAKRQMRQDSERNIREKRIDATIVLAPVTSEASRTDAPAPSSIALNGFVPMEAALAPARNRRIKPPDQLRKELLETQQSAPYLAILERRSTLPMYQHREILLKAVKSHRLCIVSAETGSGKTTQVPQLILDDLILAGNGHTVDIICTQPRVLAATSVAERVAQEKSQGPIGGVVGYQVRMMNKTSRDTQITFCTTGVLLRRILSRDGITGVSHIIIDEVHERTTECDVLLLLLKNILRDPASTLKVLLMSATADTEKIRNYFARELSGAIPIIHVPGRTFPVREYFLPDVIEMTGYIVEEGGQYTRQYASKWDMNDYDALAAVRIKMRDEDGKRGAGSIAYDKLEVTQGTTTAANSAGYSAKTLRMIDILDPNQINYDLIEALVEKLHSQMDLSKNDANAILIFLPGVDEIRQLVSQLSSNRNFSKGFLIIGLHSGTEASEQAKAFQRPKPGIMKVIAATNVAETSITIDDVAYVIDTGVVKENRFILSSRTSALVEEWVSQSSALQRRGRAGRVRPGQCFHLYTTYEFQNVMRPEQLPEIFRAPLTELCLELKAGHVVGGDVAAFCSQLIDPPSTKAIQTAIAILREVGAVDNSNDQQLTALGYHLAPLPIEVRLGKMLLFGALFRCLDPILTIVACLSGNKGPFHCPLHQREDAQAAKAKLCAHESDHLVTYAAYNKWKQFMAEIGCSIHNRSVHAAERAFCRQNFLNSNVMRGIASTKERLVRSLQHSEFVSKSYQCDAPEGAEISLEDSNSNIIELVKAVLCAGLYPQVVQARCNPNGGVSLRQAPVGKKSVEQIYLHPSSCLHQAKSLQHSFLVYQMRLRTKRLCVHDATSISPLTLMLFGGSFEILPSEGKVQIDGWIEISIPAKNAALLKGLRQELDRTLQQKVTNPHEPLAESAGKLVDTVANLLLQAGASDS
eukprot:c17918_g1_i2.p1 GENE.c17918_g1_i2~~c17918_g1_i2.p1  ORF type:complete len:1219 (-),score=289.44 c17918_g1_i2:58-3714(-)